MTDATGRTPSQRWTEIEKTLHARGFLRRSVFLRDDNLNDLVDQVPYGVAELTALTPNFPAVAAELESVFKEHEMAVVDVFVCRDDAGGGTFFAWFHPSERLRSLSGPMITLEGVTQRLHAVAEKLTARGLEVIEQEPCETAYGPHGRLVVQRTVVFVREGEDEDKAERDADVGTAKDGGMRVLNIVSIGRDPSDTLGEEEEEVELVLGRWGWASSDSDLWLLPPSSASTTELDDLVVIDMGVAEVESTAEDSSGAFAPTWVDVVGAAMAINILAPFVQTLAKRTGEDVYGALRKVIRNQVGSHGRTRLHDPFAHTDLLFDPPLPDEAVMQLARVNPSRLRNAVAEWDQESGTWKISRKPRGKT
jgi:hypothetical protein